MKTAEKKVTVLTVLQSKGFEPVVSAIKAKLPFLAEANLLEVEMGYAMTADEYSWEENRTIEEAIEECWRRIEKLKTEREDLR